MWYLRTEMELTILYLQYFSAIWNVINWKAAEKRFK